MDDRVYKIFTENEWTHFRETGRFGGSADDARDGFIHLSTRDQVEGVMERFFADRGRLYIAEFSVSDFQGHLRWERSVSGEDYPHLYGRELHFGQCLGLIQIK